jgi:hypothetical protein
MGKRSSKKEQRSAQKLSFRTAAPPVWERFIATWPWSILLVLLLVGAARIVATYSVYSHTSDEPAHIACGMEWLVRGTYTYEPQHPPLARVLTALGPYLDGSRPYMTQTMWLEGASILYLRDRYDRTLASARLGILPFYWIGTCVVFLWARRSYGTTAAVFAAFLFSFLPPILAHSGLATTDMALTATMGAVFLVLPVWLAKPTLAWSLFLGACVALSVLSKFSSLAFFPACALATAAAHLVSQRPPAAIWWKSIKPYLAPCLAVIATALLIVWAGYRFSFSGYPAPEFFAGIEAVRKHNQVGHRSYLLGEVAQTGWWYYFPVILAVKTPAPVIALLAIGAAVAVARRRWYEIAFAAGLLVVSMSSRINIGVRHILPIYIAFAILGSLGALWLLARRKTWATWTVAGLLLWFAADSLLSHPDYLPYFNFLAGDTPESIVVDSDLDWGQDMKRVAKRLRELGASEVAFSPFIVADLSRLGFPPIRELDPRRPLPGWNAVDFTALKAYRLGLLEKDTLGAQLWPEAIKPTERVGKSTLLFYIPPNR